MLTNDFLVKVEVERFVGGSIFRPALPQVLEQVIQLCFAACVMVVVTSHGPNTRPTAPSSGALLSRFDVHFTSRRERVRSARRSFVEWPANHFDFCDFKDCLITGMYQCM